MKKSVCCYLPSDTTKGTVLMLPTAAAAAVHSSPIKPKAGTKQWQLVVEKWFAIL